MYSIEPYSAVVVYRNTLFMKEDSEIIHFNLKIKYKFTIGW